MITERQQRINELETLVHRLAWNDAMGCHTRDGFAKYIWPGVLKDPKKNPRYFVFFDVDGVHALNESAGTYDVFDGIMREVNATVRSTDAVVAQKNSGDEFLLCLIETPDRHAPEPEKVIERLTEELAKHGLTAIFAWGEVKSPNLDENVKPLADRVLEAKRARGTSR